MMDVLSFFQAVLFNWAGIATGGDCRLSSPLFRVEGQTDA
jgi:hypothetical protein